MNCSFVALSAFYSVVLTRRLIFISVENCNFVALSVLYSTAVAHSLKFFQLWPAVLQCWVCFLTFLMRD